MFYATKNVSKMSEITRVKWHLILSYSVILRWAIMLRKTNDQNTNCFPSSFNKIPERHLNHLTIMNGTSLFEKVNENQFQDPQSGKATSIYT